jgi:hypothetical protein
MPKEELQTGVEALQGADGIGTSRKEKANRMGHLEPP